MRVTTRLLQKRATTGGMPPSTGMNGYGWQIMQGGNQKGLAVLVFSRGSDAYDDEFVVVRQILKVLR